MSAEFSAAGRQHGADDGGGDGHAALGGLARAGSRPYWQNTYTDGLSMLKPAGHADAWLRDTGALAALLEDSTLPAWLAAPVQLQLPAGGEQRAV